MKQTPEAEAFIARIIALPDGPGISLDESLQPSLDDEAELRKLWATDKSNKRLEDPYVGLVDVFAAPTNIRTTRARVPKDEEDLTAKHIMPLPEDARRKEGTPSMVGDLDEFKRNWAIFTEGALSQLIDWNNVVAAGGAVQACLAPLEAKEKESKRAIRKHYHSVAYPTSDVDLFLYGLDKEQAEKKIIAIYEAIRDSVPWDVTCIRTKHTVSIHSQYPYRSLQIVLRLYHSPAEVLAGFDIDAPSCLWNGERVLANPRAIVSMMRQANTVDMTRRSPSYEVRLAKYSTRGFEVYVPTLEREKIDPTIYERAISRIEGLARLLVLEKLYDVSVRNKFIDSRRALRGRPYVHNRYNRNKKKLKGDLKFDTSVVGLEMNDYDVSSLHIPYGPGWTARRIEKLVYQTDLGMNSTFNPKNKDRRLHRHPAFFGTMEECLDDCCECCPEPIDEDERQLQKEEGDMYIRGRISFIEVDPGRQSMTGSFNPIDVGEWSAQVYIGDTEAFFNAIANHDIETVRMFIERSKVGASASTASTATTPSTFGAKPAESDKPEPFDLNRRDQVGRTALHLAILVKAEQIALELIDAGARMIYRLADGRNALHLAAQYDLPGVVRKLGERSMENEREAEKEGKIEGKENKEGGGNRKGDKMDVDVEEGGGRPSSEDDWSSGDDGVIPMDTDMSGEDEADDEEEDEDGEAGDEDEDNESESSKEAPTPELEDLLALDDDKQPDILDFNLPDWDLGWTPLCHAVYSSSVSCIEELIKFGADVDFLSSGRDTHVHPLTVTLLRENEEEASKGAERLLLAGASSSQADSEMNTIFHKAVQMDKLKLVATLLRCDPNKAKVLDFPSVGYCVVKFPIVTALQERKWAMVAVLLAFGAKVKFDEEDIRQAIEASDQNISSRFFQNGSISAVKCNFLPVETAIANNDDIIKVLIALGAEYDIPIRQVAVPYSGNNERMNLIDWVRKAGKHLEEQLAKAEDSKSEKEKDTYATGENPTSWRTFIVNLMNEFEQKDIKSSDQSTGPDRDKIARQHARQYRSEVEDLLAGLGAITWDEVNPDKPWENVSRYAFAGTNNNDNGPREVHYMRFDPASYSRGVVAKTTAALYEQLFEACFTGDNEKVQGMCLPKEGSGVTPLNINAQLEDPTIYYIRTGFTPLYATLKGRQWNTAKLVVAIAVAQYRPSDKREKKFKSRIIFDDDDSDNESCGSDDSGDTVEQEEVTFIDVAKKRSVVESNVHPRDLLNATVRWHVWDEEDKNWDSRSSSMLVQAVEEDDFEAFVNIANLYESCPLLVPLDGHIFDAIVKHDRPEMLDEYIRRTGWNIDLNAGKHSDEDIALAVNDQNKLYLGLKVHGKKRMDLAKADDPNSVYLGGEEPLVWQAALQGARKVLDYLAGDRPYAAYKYYSSTHGDELAYKIRRAPDLQERLPVLLGWTVTDLGDSPLTAAIMGDDLDTVKDLFKNHPKLMSKAVHERVKFIGFNLLMLAIKGRNNPKMVDFLLSRGLSPMESDSVRGWNIYHQLCEDNHCDTLEHLLNKLPRDVNEVLLCQKSKDRLNTPIQIAIKRGGGPSIRACQLIAEYTKAPLLIRDVDGSAPIHKAVQGGFSQVVKILIDNMPAEGLFLENGVGETVIDMATLARAFEVLRSVSYGRGNPRILSHGNYGEQPLRIDINFLEEELPKLKKTMEDLHEAGGLPKDGLVTKELMKFVLEMESKLEAEKKAEEERVEVVQSPKQEDRNPTDHQDITATLKYVTEAVAATGPDNWRKRELARLLDVQRSVQGNLVGHDGKSGRPRIDVVEAAVDQGDGLGEESEKTEKDHSMVLKQTLVQPDIY